MIQIATIPAGRRPEGEVASTPSNPLPGTGAEQRQAPAAPETASERPCLFVVPPPQPVWPRVFPGL